MKNWLKSLYATIPCQNCSDHYKSYIDQNEDNLDKICSDRNKLFNFLVDIHNKVNERLNKPQMDYKTAYSMYS